MNPADGSLMTLLGLRLATPSRAATYPVSSQQQPHQELSSHDSPEEESRCRWEDTEQGASHAHNIVKARIRVLQRPCARRIGGQSRTLQDLSNLPRRSLHTASILAPRHLSPTDSGTEVLSRSSIQGRIVQSAVVLSTAQEYHFQSGVIPVVRLPSINFSFRPDFSKLEPWRLLILGLPSHASAVSLTQD